VELAGMFYLLQQLYGKFYVSDNLKSITLCNLLHVFQMFAQQ